MDFNRALTQGAQIDELDGLWRLELPPGQSSKYRLAQLDDYAKLKRKDFGWSAPATLSLHARASSSDIPGTWGFGFWNDPFSSLIGLGGMKRPLPTLPNAAWFFHASPDNYLFFRDDTSPHGLLAATYRSVKIPSIFLTPAILAFPILKISAAARILRRLLSRIINDDNIRIDVDVAEWNEYRLTWSIGSVTFEVNGQAIFSTACTPRAPLGLVIWIDNQYAAFKPSGEIKAGALENHAPAWLEINDLSVQ